MTAPIPILRVARPSDNLDALLTFYVDGLGLVLIDVFRDHDGFDGVIVGRKGWPYHLEFTRAHGHAPAVRRRRTIFSCSILRTSGIGATP